MDRLSSFLASSSDPLKGGGDTFADRLNCKYTPSLLFLFVFIVTTKNIAGAPIACWCPDHFTSSQVDFTNQVCWVYNTYYLPYEERIPKRGESRNTIGYYQWVALLLSFMAVMFYVPRLIWIGLNTKSGIAVTSITDAAIDYQRNTDSSDRVKNLQFMAKHMGSFLKDLNRRIMLAGKTKTIAIKLFHGNYLVTVLLFIKCMYLLNIIGQLMLLNYFLKSKYILYGWEIIERIVKGQSLSDSKRFPRVTMCDLDIRRLGTVQPYTVMCALPVNLFNEIIFIFIWFWYVVVGLSTICSLLYWLFVSVIAPHQIHFVKARLIAMDRLGSATNHMVHNFVHNFLHNDGILIIKLVAENSSDLIAAQLICEIWTYYRDNRLFKDKLTVHDTLDSDNSEVIYEEENEPTLGPIIWAGKGEKSGGLRSRNVASSPTVSSDASSDCEYLPAITIQQGESKPKVHTVSLKVPQRHL